MDVSVATAADDTSDSLVGTDGRPSIERIARLLPAALRSVFGFECHLNRGAPHADFLVCITRTGRGRQILAGLDSARALPPSLLEHPIWTRVRAFSLAWATDTSPIQECVKNLWLEFDVEGRSETLPVPSVFISFEGSLQRRWSCPGRGSSTTWSKPDCVRPSSATVCWPGPGWLRLCSTACRGRTISGEAGPAGGR